MLINDKYFVLLCVRLVKNRAREWTEMKIIWNDAWRACVCMKCNGILSDDTTNGHKSNDRSPCDVCSVLCYAMLCLVCLGWFFSVFIFINHGISFDNSSSSSSSSSVPDDSPDDRNGVDFNWSLVGTIPRHLPHAPLFKSADKIYILPQRTHSSCGSPANNEREKKTKKKFCR